MANTEGISDENLAKLLTININDEHLRQTQSAKHSKHEQTRTKETHPKRVKMPKGMIERQRMMDEFDNSGEINFQPSAKVIRSSNRNRVAPIVKSAKGTRTSNNNKGKAIHPGSSINHGTQNNGTGGYDDEGQVELDAKEENQAEAENGTSKTPVPPPPPVLRSEPIKERKIDQRPMEPQDATKKISKFKLRQQQQKASNSTNTGFPSFDIPVGALTRKGKLRTERDNGTSTGTGNENGGPSRFKSTRSSTSSNTSIPEKNRDGVVLGTNTNTNSTTNTNTDSSEADKMVAGMSQAEIQQNIAEIESMLSAETIQFLKKRHEGKKQSQKRDEVTEAKVSPLQEDVAKAEVSHVHAAIAMDASTMDAIIAAKDAAAADEHGQGIEEDANESELEFASKLLRSTAMRQRILGAKNMCELLDARMKSVRGSDSAEDSAEYPDLLPVALRCILDTPSPLKHLQLISYTIRSIYNLMLLFVHPSHRIQSKSLRGRGDDADIIFQQEFMHDAVPVPSASGLYSKEGGVQMDKSSLGDGCYATNASAESAASDAKSFYSDPAWNMLSKMRIIPCLSHILLAHARITCQSKGEGSTLLSVETVSSVCGILAMLSLRSPGAAVAISQHQDLLPSLISLTLEPGMGKNETGFVVDASLAFPVIYLSCIICRQSKTAAKSLERMVERVAYITATDAVHHDEYRLQQWCMILWRTMLRYGLGLRYLSTILPLSVPRLASESNSNSSDEFSLGAEYLSAYSVICECVKIATMHKGFLADPDKSILSSSDRETLAMSGMWFSSHAQNCADDIIKDAGIGSDIAMAKYMKQTSAKLRFLSSYFDASSPSDIMGTIPRSKSIAFVPLISLETFLAVLHSIVDSQVLAKALDKVVTLDENSYSMMNEASACSLIESFFSCVRILSDKLDTMLESKEEGKVSSNIETEVGLLVRKIFQVSIVVLETVQPESENTCQLPRMSWVNRAWCALGIFLSNSCSSHITPTPVSSDTIQPLIQSFVLRLIGRLQRGEESRAALLFSQDTIFTCGFSEEDHEMPNAYLVQDVMMRELCSTARAQSQLDHSFKLDGRPGLTAAGKGHFALESLRIETDFKDQSAKSKEVDSEMNSLILPLGLDWIWKLLSSTIVTDGNRSGSQSGDSLSKATRIINSAIQFIVYIEMGNLPYARLVQVGAKMYFLLNACFNPEIVISNKMFETLFLQAFSIYYQKFLEEEAQNAKHFIAACYKHSSNMKKFDVDSAEDYDKVMDLFFNVDGIKDDSGLSSKHLKAIDDFVEDLTGSFIDFGAQYELFVHAVRFLLLPGMPVRLRIRVLDKLKDLLHLLTTVAESTEASGIQLRTKLTQYFIGGLPLIDDSSRDNGVFLDTLSRILKTSNLHLVERQDGFFYFFAIGCLARNLASNSIRCDCGVKAMRHRLKGLDKNIWNNIVFGAHECIRKKCASSEELADIITHVCSEEFAVSMANDDFDIVVNQLRELHLNANK